MERQKQIKDLVFMAMYLALFIILDWLSNQIGIFKMPQGGTLGLGVLPLILSSYHLGWKKGVIVGVLSVILQFMTGSVYIVTREDGFGLFGIFIQFIMEYPLAFGCYGLSSIFPTKGKIYTGPIFTNLIRLIIHTIAGTIFWLTPWWGSLSYNAWYMIPTMIFTFVITCLLVPRLKYFIHTSRV